MMGNSYIRYFIFIQELLVVGCNVDLLGYQLSPISVSLHNLISKVIFGDLVYLVKGALIFDLVSLA